MDYITVNEAKTLGGLRLVLTADAPGPWGESAKAIFAVKNIPFIAVRQDAGSENADLQAWTGQSSAPVAVYNDEPPRCQSLDILYLAERLNMETPLIPADIQQRVTMMGLVRELIGELGFAWQRRLLMLQPLMGMKGLEEIAGRLSSKYGYSEQAAAAAPQRCVDILQLLASQLHTQKQAGSDYFIGHSLTALDIYWANFAAMLKPLPPEASAMDAGMRHSYENLHPLIAESYDPVLLEHRDFMYQQHLRLPLDF